jgi:hypothetical protein
LRKESLTEQQRHLRADCSKLLRQQTAKARSPIVDSRHRRTARDDDDEDRRRTTERKDWKYGKSRFSLPFEVNEVNEDQRGTD